MRYDYIIIGAGSAGCVLANRLSAGGSNSVLLLEAGGSDRNMNVSIPAAFAKLFKTKRDWDYSTEPEPNAKGRELYVPRGKMLGGSSSMNAMIYIRGRREDYDGWAAMGCHGWSYDEVLPYFIRSEDNQRIRDEYHGVGGELIVSDLQTVNPLTDAFVHACETWGMKRTDDFNGESQLGSGVYQVTQKKGARWSTAAAFLRPAMKRDNLTVTTDALVHRVEIDNGRATGVTYSTGSTTTTAHVDGEVILSAGAIGSPQILMLSGVGPSDELSSHGIDTHVSLPVGKGLQDHPVATVIYDCTENVSIDDAESPRHLLEYAMRKTGKLSSNVGEGGAFVKVREGVAAADIQYHFGPAFFSEHGFDTRDGAAFTIGPTLVSVESRGQITLRSADPTAKPRIESNTLGTDNDVRSMIGGVRLGRELANQLVFDRYRGDEIYPSAQYQTDAELEEWVRQSAELLYHPTGTCAMGPAGDAVVDPELRVNGVDGLRVADASIMPEIVGGNTNAPTIMIAEKAADMVRAAAG